MTTVAVFGAKELVEKLGADISVNGIVSAVFDDASETWLLRTVSGDEHRADVVVDAERIFHEPRNATAPRVPHARDTKPRWLSRKHPQVGTVPRCSIADDVHDNALVGTRGLTIQHAWRDGAVAYLGIAVHGFPNYFMLLGPGSPVDARDYQVRYIADCLQRMQRKGATRIEVRRSAQQQYMQRARVKPPASAFDFVAPGTKREIYDGPATLTVGDEEHTVRVRLTGHLDPIDGKYHWQGTVFGTATKLPKQPVTLSVATLTTQARITEQTPWGSYSIAGVGAPPYELT